MRATRAPGRARPAERAAGEPTAPGPGRPDVSALIVTLDVRELTLTCIERVRERSGGLDVEVVLVDNGSADGTVDAVRERFPEARVIANPGNAGFARANNQALAVARGRHVLYLNPDTEVGEGTLEACAGALDADPTLGMVGCRLVYPDGRTQYEGGRRDYRLRHLLWEAFYLHVLFPRHPLFAHQLMGDWDHLDERDVEAVSGAFMMVPADVARDVGGLPEDVFVYHEDLSLCLRVRRAGRRIRYLGTVTTLHHSGAGSRKLPLALGLLEGEVRVRLVRERSGRLAGAAARVLFGARAAARLAISVGARVWPGRRRLEAHRPAVLDSRKYLLHLLWSVHPGLVRRHMPAVEVVPPLSPAGEGP